MQQLVNDKTNRPVWFEYIPASADGMPIGLIRIQADQERPLFLKKAFGKLKSDTVYVRRGSSTAEAKPDEVARMGARAAAQAHAPTLTLGLREHEKHSASCSDRLTLKPTPLETLPEDSMPDDDIQAAMWRLSLRRRPSREAQFAFFEAGFRQ